MWTAPHCCRFCFLHPIRAAPCSRRACTGCSACNHMHLSLSLSLGSRVRDSLTAATAAAAAEEHTEQPQMVKGCDGDVNSVTMLWNFVLWIHTLVLPPSSWRCFLFLFKNMMASLIVVFALWCILAWCRVGLSSLVASLAGILLMLWGMFDAAPEGTDVKNDELQTHEQELRTVKKELNLVQKKKELALPVVVHLFAAVVAILCCDVLWQQVHDWMQLHLHDMWVCWWCHDGLWLYVK